VASGVKRRRLAVLLVAGVAFAAGVAAGAGPEYAVPRTAASLLSDTQLAGQRFIAGFPGTEPPAAVRRMIREGRLAGVILFSENLPSRAAGRRLIDRLQAIPRPAHLGDPLLVMVDQEGGLVKRLSGAPSTSAEEMGRRGPTFSRREGRRTAANIRGVGFNVDLAPVLDVGRQGGVIEETDRAFGDTPREVTQSGDAFANGLRKGGTAATAKHFPGLGSARENTDFAVQRIRLSKRALRRVDERPYHRFIHLGGDLVMLSNAIYPAFSGKPAVFTRAIATGELRGHLGFRGVSITDELGAAAAEDFGGPAHLSVAAARSGVDLLLFADWQSAAQGHRALRRHLTAGDVSREHFEDSVQRVLALRHRFGPKGGTG
jgi:beta-N-acetylhexosaminidase